MKSEYNLPTGQFPSYEQPNAMAEVYREILCAIQEIQAKEVIPAEATDLSKITSSVFSPSALAGRLYYYASEPLEYGNWVRPINSTFVAKRTSTSYRASYYYTAGISHPGNGFPLFVLKPAAVGEIVPCASSGILYYPTGGLTPGTMYRLSSSGQFLSSASASSLTDSTGERLYNPIALALSSDHFFLKSFT